MTCSPMASRLGASSNQGGGITGRDAVDVDADLRAPRRRSRMYPYRTCKTASGAATQRGPASAL